MKTIFTLFFSILLSASYVSATDMIIGGETVYQVVKGDTLEGIGAKLGVKWQRLVQENSLDLNRALKIGLKLRVNNRRIVPKVSDNGLIINIPDRMLYFLKNGRLETAFPVGLGTPLWRGSTKWRTPEGKFKIVNKQKNPPWFVPESIQEEMELEGKPVDIIVPPGPDNPLGRYILRTSIQGIDIHETIWPTSVYQFRSHGCIRVLPEHMEKLFRDIEPEATGEIIYNPVKLAVSKEGRVFLEVHRDIYSKLNDLENETKKLIRKAAVEKKINWQKVNAALKDKSGIAEDVSL